MEIKPKLVTALSYGQEAHRRVGTMIALAFISPVALFGLFHKTRLHFIGMEYTMPDGKKGGLLIQGDKDNYRAILVALQSVSGVTVTVSDKEREFVPVGVKTAVTTAPTEAGAPAASANKSETPADAASTGSVQVGSTPDGAEVYADGAFVGNAPSTLKLSAGKHVIKVTAAGHKDWTREITVQAGSELKLNAGLEISKVMKIKRPRDWDL